MNNLRSISWCFTKYRNFTSFLESDFGIVNIQPFKPMNWHFGCNCFTGYSPQDNGRVVFVKLGGQLGLATREAEAISLVKPHLCNELCLPSLFASDGHADYSFVATDFIEGRPLTVDTVLKSITESCLEKESFVEEILQQMLDILRALHAAQIVHRDVRPDNLLFRVNSQTRLPQLTLIDFAYAVGPEGEITYLDLQDKKVRILSALGESLKPDKLVWDDAYSFYTIACHVTSIAQGTNIEKYLNDLESMIGLNTHSGLDCDT